MILLLVKVWFTTQIFHTEAITANWISTRFKNKKAMKFWSRDYEKGQDIKKN